jgi:hypothetical protein
MISFSQSQLFITSAEEGSHFRTARHSALIKTHIERRKTIASLNSSPFKDEQPYIASDNVSESST